MKTRRYIFLIFVVLFTIICIMVVKKRDNKIIENEYVTEKINIKIEENLFYSQKMATLAACETNRRKRYGYTTQNGGIDAGDQ